MTAPTETRADEARLIFAWLSAHPTEWGMFLGIAKLEATTSAVRAYTRGDAEVCTKCGRLSEVRGYNEMGKALCGRCAR